MGEGNRTRNGQVTTCLQFVHVIEASVIGDSFLKPEEKENVLYTCLRMLRVVICM